MDHGKKVFFWIAFLIFLTIAAYFMYGEKWGAERALSALGDVKGIALEKISEVAAFVKENTGKTFEKGIESSYSFARRGVGEGIQSAGEAILDIGTRVGNEVGTTTTSSSSGIQNTISPPSSGSGFFSPSPLYALLGVRGTPTSFFIRAGAGYTVEWGDGTKESGEASSSSTAMLTHTWAKSGDYVIHLSLEEKQKGEIERFSIPIRIYETQ